MGPEGLNSEGGRGEEGEGEVRCTFSEQEGKSDAIGKRKGSSGF